MENGPPDPACRLSDLTLDAVERALSLLQDAGRSARTINVSVHTAASLMVNAGIDLYVVGKVLGHTSAETTKRYAHLVLDKQRQAVEALENTLRTVSVA